MSGKGTHRGGVGTRLIAIIVLAGPFLLAAILFSMVSPWWVVETSEVDGTTEANLERRLLWLIPTGRVELGTLKSATVERDTYRKAGRVSTGATVERLGLALHHTVASPSKLPRGSQQVVGQQVVEPTGEVITRIDDIGPSADRAGARLTRLIDQPDGSSSTWMGTRGIGLAVPAVCLSLSLAFVLLIVARWRR